MDPLPLMMRLGVHTHAIFQKDPSVFFEDIRWWKNNPSTQTLDLIFFEFPSWMYIVANLRISIRGLGQCMVLQTLRTHIWRYKNCVFERLLEWKHGTVCCMGVAGMEQLEHANPWIILRHLKNNLWWFWSWFLPDGRIQFFWYCTSLTQSVPVLQITFPVIVLIDLAAIRWWLGQTRNCAVSGWVATVNLCCPTYNRIHSHDACIELLIRIFHRCIYKYFYSYVHT